MGTEARAQGPVGRPGRWARQRVRAGLVLSLAQLPAGPAAASARAGAQRALSRGPGPRPAPTYSGVGRVPRGQPRTLRLKVPHGTYEMLGSWREGTA